MQAMDFQTFAGRRINPAPLAEGGWNIAHTTWTPPDVADPIVNITLSGAGRDAFWGWPEDSVIEELRVEFARATDPAERKRIADAVQERAYEQVFYLPTGQFQLPSGIRNNITGVIEAPVILLYNIEKSAE
jgi:peptide/nickel transport system substrate-binding protein